MAGAVRSLLTLIAAVALFGPLVQAAVPASGLMVETWDADTVTAGVWDHEGDGSYHVVDGSVHLNVTETEDRSAVTRPLVLGPSSAVVRAHLTIPWAGNTTLWIDTTDHPVALRVVNHTAFCWAVEGWNRCMQFNSTTLIPNQWFFEIHFGEDSRVDDDSPLDGGTRMVLASLDGRHWTSITTFRTVDLDSVRSITLEYERDADKSISREAWFHDVTVRPGYPEPVTVHYPCSQQRPC